MADSDYRACHYSVTVQAADLSVLHMLRGLAQHCESGSYKQIAWGGYERSRVGGRWQGGDFPLQRIR